MDSIAGQSGNVQLSFLTDVYQYAIFYATCVEVDKYGNLQNYMCDTDPTRTMELSAYSSYGDEPEEELDTGLQIIKYEAGCASSSNNVVITGISGFTSIARPDYYAN